MLYLVYILIGMLIVLGVNLLITAFWALHDMYVKKENAVRQFFCFHILCNSYLNESRYYRILK